LKTTLYETFEYLYPSKRTCQKKIIIIITNQISVSKRDIQIKILGRKGNWKHQREKLNFYILVLWDAYFICLKPESSVKLTHLIKPHSCICTATGISCNRRDLGSHRCNHTSLHTQTLSDHPTSIAPCSV